MTSSAACDSCALHRDGAEVDTLTQRLEQWKAEQRAKGADEFKVFTSEDEGTFQIYSYKNGKVLDSLKLKNFRL